MSINFKIIPILILIILISCQNEQKLKTLKDSEIYVIKTSSPYDKDDSFKFREFYFNYNIIMIDSIPEIYYHKKRFNCLTGTEPNNTLPNFCNLKPENFLASNNTSELIKIIVNDSEIPKRVYLISSNDTITDNRYFDLKTQLEKHNIKTSTRVWTEEEEEIMKSILKKINYRPENINWEKTLNVPNEFNSEIEIIEENENVP